jgi:hypothetical protein
MLKEVTVLRYVDVGKVVALFVRVNDFREREGERGREREGKRERERERGRERG